MLGKIFWYVRQNFRMFVEKYLVCPEIFFSMSGKVCRMFVDCIACSGKLYCAPSPPPNTFRPIRPWKDLVGYHVVGFLVVDSFKFNKKAPNFKWKRRTKSTMPYTDRSSRFTHRLTIWFISFFLLYLVERRCYHTEVSVKYALIPAPHCPICQHTNTRSYWGHTAEVRSNLDHHNEAKCHLLPNLFSVHHMEHQCMLKLRLKV